MVATILIDTPLDGYTSNTAVVGFTYHILPGTFILGVGDIEYSTDGIQYHSVIEGDRNQNLADSAFFPFSGPDAKFDLEFTHGNYLLRFRAIDRLNNIGPVFSLHLNVDISTSVTIDPLPDYTNNPALIVSGTMEVGATVTLTDNGTNISGITYPTPTTWQVLVTLQEGNNVFVATATDVLFNTATATDSIILDTIIPAALVVLEINPADPQYGVHGGIVLTNTANEILVGSKESNTAVWLNGIEVISNNSSTSFSLPVTLSEGVNTLHLKARDLAGNFSGEVIVIINLDTVPPQGPGILINDGTPFTLRRDVTLELTATDAVQVKYSEDINFTNVEYVPFTAPSMMASFELSRGGGTKTVYAVFRDLAGNETVPVFDSIILPSTVSAEVSRTPTMTVQSLNVTPVQNYLIRLQDNRDGTFAVELYLTLADAVIQTNRVGFVNPVPVSPGQQTYNVYSDPLLTLMGNIVVTLYVGAETVIYRYRTDVYNPDETDTNVPIIYIIKEWEDHFDAQVEVPIYEGSALGRILEYNIGGDPRKLKISKAFGIYNSDTAIVDSDYYYPVTDLDGDLYPIVGARFTYPLMSTPMEVLTFTEEDDGYVITIDKDLTRFDPTFGYEMLFSKRRKLVTDYRIFKNGRVEFYDESDEASGNVRITYSAPQFIRSVPSPEFKMISAAAGNTVTLVVEPSNLILLSDLNEVNIRFFHSLVDTSILAPSSIGVKINGSAPVITSAYRILNTNGRAEVREFTITSDKLFPTGIPSSTYGPDNPVLQKVEIVFITNSNATFSDEIQVLTVAAIVSSNCRVLINGEERFLSSDPVSKHLDTYEIRVQAGFADVVYNDKIVYTEEGIDLHNATASIGAGARVDNDRVNAAFSNLTTIRYIDSSPTTLSLPGRYVQTEVNLRRDSDPIDRSFSMDFVSADSLYPPRLYTPDIPSFEFFDTATVAIIGMGRREEVLLRQGSGEEDEGQPVDFNPNNKPDGRHFQVTSFPIVINTLKVFLTHNAIEQQLSENVDYHTNLVNGYIVLFHPIALGDQLCVTYTSQADSNAPEMFFDVSGVIAKFGTPSAENTLSLGAQIAFENGAQRVLAVQALDPTIDPNWKNAYDSLAKEEAYFIVPMPPNNYPQVAVEGLDHVEKQSQTARRHERVLLLGETSDLTSDDLSSFRNTFRTVFIRPGIVSRVIGGGTVVLDGRYEAAAYAGRVSSLSVIAEPMTGKDLIGFDISKNEKFTNIELENLANNGITMLRKVPTGGRVYRSVTTSDSGIVVEQEQSLVRIRDYLAINVRKVLEDRFVGQAVASSEIVDSIISQTRYFLETQKAHRLISKYDNLRANVDSVDPRQIDVAFDVEPVFPLNNIVLTVNVVTRI